MDACHRFQEHGAQLNQMREQHLSWVVRNKRVTAIGRCRVTIWIIPQLEQKQKVKAMQAADVVGELYDHSCTSTDIVRFIFTLD